MPVLTLLMTAFVAMALFVAPATAQSSDFGFGAEEFGAPVYFANQSHPGFSDHDIEDDLNLYAIGETLNAIATAAGDADEDTDANKQAAPAHSTTIQDVTGDSAP